jgi:uncharacterized membrane protein YeaQ/YmgE (transglycosylase-associated protein family)
MVMPGKQNIGVIMTVLLGIVGSFLGTWFSYKLGYSNQNGGFKIIPFLVGIVVAALLIAAYLGITEAATLNSLVGEPCRPDRYRHEMRPLPLDLILVGRSRAVRLTASVTRGPW